MINHRTDQVRAFCDELFGGIGTQRPAPPVRILPTRLAGQHAGLGPRTRAHLESTGPGAYPSPSEADAAAAAALIASGHTAEEALGLLLESPRGQDAMRRKGERHGERYLERTVAHAAAFVGPVVQRADGLRGLPPPSRPSRTAPLPAPVRAAVTVPLASLRRPA